MLLQGRHGRGAVEAVVAPVKRDAIAVEQGAQDLHRLAQARLAYCRRVERPAHGGVLREAVPGSEAHLQSAAAQVVERRQLLGQGHGMVKVVVEHQCAQADELRAQGGRSEGDKC